MNKLIIVLICVSSLLTGCNGSGGIKKRASSLEKSVNEYAFALRWGRYRDAHDYHAEEDGSKPPYPLDKLELIRVTSHTIFETIINEEVTEATVKGELKYYSTEYGTMRKISLDQTWWYESESKKWYQKGEMPKFR